MNTAVCFWFASILSVSVCLPPHRRGDVPHGNEENMVEHEGYPDMDEMGIEYTRYLRQVIDTLEKDETFKKKLENAKEHDIKSAKIAEELEYVSHHVRSKLDELKRTELDRLRKLAKQAYGHEVEKNGAFGHLDHENPNTFEIKDLKKLIHKTAQDLEEADRRRKEEFKTYEMEKHFEREQMLKNMTEEERKKFVQHEEEVRKHEEVAAKRVHHPGSKQQLEEVWENQDHMSKNDFNPRTFFAMHDMDNNGFLDEDEIKTLFIRELDKLYASGSLQGDAVERAEEMERMREHVFSEVDKNKDRLISWEEFYAMSAQPDFNEDPGWQPMDTNQVYTPEEWQAYEQQRLNEMETMRRAGQLPNQGYYPGQANGGYPDPNMHHGANGYGQQYYPQQGGVHPQQGNGYQPQMGGYPQQYPQPPVGHAQQQAAPQQAHYQPQQQAIPQQVQYQNQPVHPQQQGLPQQVQYQNAVPQQNAVPVQQPAPPSNIPQQQPVPAQGAQQAAVPPPSVHVPSSGGDAQPHPAAAPQQNNVNSQQQQQQQQPVGVQFQSQNHPHFESKTN